LNGGVKGSGTRWGSRGVKGETVNDDTGGEKKKKVRGKKTTKSNESRVSKK